MERGIALYAADLHSTQALIEFRHRFQFTAITVLHQPLDEKQEKQLKGLAKQASISRLVIINAEALLKELKKLNLFNKSTIKYVLFRIAVAYAEKETAHSILTGEHLSEVTSEALKEIKMLSNLIPIEIIRPLLTKTMKELDTLSHQFQKTQFCNFSLLHNVSQKPMAEFEQHLPQTNAFLDKMLPQILNKAQLYEI